MVLIGFDHFHSDEYGDARGVRGASSRARETRPLRALLGQLNNWWPRKCNGVDTDPKPPGFSAVFRPSSGALKDVPRNYAMEPELIAGREMNLKSRRLLTYEW